MHDRYLYWSLPSYGGAIAASPARKSIEEQVLKDLASTDNELVRLEILDSYAAYAQRCYRAQMVEGFTQEASRLATYLFGPWLRDLIPQVQVVHRAAKAGVKAAF